MSRISIIRLGAFLSIVTLPLSALGQNPTPSKFYQFEGFTVNGDIRQPSVTQHIGKERVRFDRLLELKKSFLPEIIESSKERSLK